MKIGVIGAGTMGQGIAKAFAQVEGNTVALCDIKQEWAENGLAKIKKGYEKLVLNSRTRRKNDETYTYRCQSVRAERKSCIY